MKRERVQGRGSEGNEAEDRRKKRVGRSREVRKNARECKTGTDEERRDLLDTFHDCSMKEDKSRLKEKSSEEESQRESLKEKKTRTSPFIDLPENPARLPFRLFFG